MSDFDERGRRIPDEDERQEALQQRRALRRRSSCLCLDIAMPGSCPGPENCPVHGEDLSS